MNESTGIQYNDLPDELFTAAEFNEQTAEEVGFSNYSYWRSTLRTFLKSPLIRVMLIVVTLLVAFTFLYPMISDIDPYSVSLSASDWNLPISTEHPFGTDGVGRDIWARVWSVSYTHLARAQSPGRRPGGALRPAVSTVC